MLMDGREPRRELVRDTGTGSGNDGGTTVCGPVDGIGDELADDGSLQANDMHPHMH